MSLKSADMLHIQVPRPFCQVFITVRGKLFGLMSLGDHPVITSAHLLTFSDQLTHYVSMDIVMNCHFLNPPTLFADVIYGWSLSHTAA